MLHVVKNANVNNVNKFVDVIFHNFQFIENYEGLMHNKKEIHRLLADKNSKILFIMNNKKIGAYLVGELKKLLDGRNVFYISYLYTAEKFRGLGYASKLLAYVDAYVKKINYDGVMLTHDTDDEMVHNFYLMRGFMPDQILRKYSRFDILYKASYSY